MENERKAVCRSMTGKSEDELSSANLYLYLGLSCGEIVGKMQLK